jgi:hypothetical protein
VTAAGITAIVSQGFMTAGTGVSASMTPSTGTSPTITPVDVRIPAMAGSYGPSSTMTGA